MNPDSRWILLVGTVAGLGFGLLLASFADTDRVRVLPLGDSITEGKWQRPSYRHALWQLLRASGCAVDFVGSQRGPAGEPPFDDDHEGHWGWRTDQIAAALPGWRAARAPDVALIHLGTNDVLQGVPTEQALRNLRSIIAQLRAGNPQVTVLLAQVIPAREENAPGIEALNAGIAAMATAEHSETSHIVLVNQHRGYDPALNYDGLHPDEDGAERLARRWHDALLPIVADACRESRDSR